MGILLSVPIGIIYNLMVSKISHMITKDDSQKDKIQKNLLISIIGGIVALVLAFYVFGNEQIENKIVKYGLAMGGIILLIYSTVCNWDTLEDMTKLLFLLGILIVAIIYSYKYIKNNSQKTNKKNNNIFDQFKKKYYIQKDKEY